MAPTLHPDNTIANAWTLVGAATAHECVDEGVATANDDTDYVSSGVQDALCEVALENPAGTPAVLTGHIMRVRWRPAGGLLPRIQSMSLELMQGSMSIASRVFAHPAGTWTTSSFELTVMESGLITNYTDLRFRLRPQAIFPGVIRVTAVELELPDISLALSDTTNVTRATIEVASRVIEIWSTRSTIEVSSKTPRSPRITRATIEIAARPDPDTRRLSRASIEIASKFPAIPRMTRLSMETASKASALTARNLTRVSFELASSNPSFAIRRITRANMELAMKTPTDQTRRTTRASAEIAFRLSTTDPIFPMALPPVLLNAIWPNWATSVRIESSYTTDIGSSATTVSEERRGLVGRPFRLLTARFNGIARGEAARLWANMLRLAHTRLPIPVFCDFSKTTQTSGGVTIWCDTTSRRFFKGGRVGIHAFDSNNRPTNVQFGIVSVLLVNRIILVAPLVGTYPAGSRAYPCMDAEIELNLSGQHLTDEDSEVEITFSEVPGRMALPALASGLPAGFPVYLGMPVLDTRPEWSSGNVETAIVRSGRRYAQGRAEVIAPVGSKPQFEHSLPFEFVSRAAYWKLLTFFDTRRGRLFSFWAVAPNEAWKEVALTTAYVDVEPNGNLQDAQTFLPYVAIVLRSGPIYIRRATYAAVGGSWRIAFDATIPSFPMSDIQRVTTAALSRFASDALAEEWITDEVVKADTIVHELLDEKDVPVPFGGGGSDVIGSPDLIAGLLAWFDVGINVFTTATSGPGGTTWPQATPYPGIPAGTWPIKAWVDARLSEFDTMVNLLPVPRLDSALYHGLIAFNQPTINKQRQTAETIVQLGIQGSFSLLALPASVLTLHDPMKGLTIIVCGLAPFGRILSVNGAGGATVIDWSEGQAKLFSGPGLGDPALFVSGITVATPGAPVIYALTWLPAVYARVYSGGIIVGEADVPASSLVGGPIGSARCLEGVATGTPPQFPKKDNGIGTTSFHDALLIYQRALTADELNAVGKYLALRYGAPWADIPVNALGGTGTGSLSGFEPLLEEP